MNYDPRKTEKPQRTDRTTTDAGDLAGFLVGGILGLWCGGGLIIALLWASQHVSIVIR